MDIVIVAQFAANIDDLKNNNGRFVFIARQLSKNGQKVELVTSNFNHTDKRFFTLDDIKNSDFKITAVKEKGYKKNVSLSRLASHHNLAKNIIKYLKYRKKPDVIYCAVPSLSVAKLVSKYCIKNDVRFIVDIQDLWPEAFKMVFNFPIISDLIFLPMTIEANKIYSRADEIVSVSETYTNRALKVNKKCHNSLTVFLGTSSENYKNLPLRKSSNNFKIAYVGSLSASYDVDLIIKAISLSKYKNEIEFIIMGDGSRREEFEKFSNSLKVNTVFTGYLLYKDMCKKLMNCDIAVNPIRKGSAGSIINKVGDYAMAGLPVINTQECEEYRNLLLQFKSGINCDSSDVTSITNALDLLIENENIRLEMGINSRKLGLEKFDRKNYEKIVKKIIN